MSDLLTTLFTYFKNFISLVIKPAIEFKKMIIDRPKEIANLTKELTCFTKETAELLNNFKTQIEQLKEHDKTHALTPRPIPNGFRIIHGNLLFDPVNNTYYCYNCYLNDKFEIVAGDTYFKRCPKCNINTDLTKP